jgi:hypothetical protein
MKLSRSLVMLLRFRVRPKFQKGEGNMRFISISSAALTAAAFLLLGTQGKADDTNNFSASFSGFQEIGPLGAGETGAILSPGQGNLTLNVDKGNQFINFQLTYSGFTNNVTQSHIHFGKDHVAGGIMVFFCVNPPANPPPPPAPTPQPCPLTGGTVTGTFAASDVIGPKTQNVTPGDFNALLAALKSNTAYGNIHTTAFPSGEIRGQILPSKKDD